MEEGMARSKKGGGVSIQAELQRIASLRDDLYRIRAEKPGSGYALDAFVKYMHEASKAGLSPTRLNTESRDEVERFFANTIPGIDGHVYWDGGKRFTRNNRTSRTPARWWWEHCHGPISTTTLRVEPVCGDPACINPDHARLESFQAQRYTDEQMLGALQVWAMRNGRTPTRLEWETSGGRPMVEIYRKRFGSWAKARAAAGLHRPRIPGNQSTEQELIESLRIARSILGRWPRTEDYRRPELRQQLRDAGQRSSQTPIYRVFGSWGAALKAAQDG
jgi:hypothetical protein